MSPQVERIADSIELGEGPHWDVAKQCLYYVDIFGKAIHRYVPSTKQHTKAVIGDNHVSLIVPVEGHTDKFIISVGRELWIITWDGESPAVIDSKKIYEIDNAPETKDNRFNDGKCDPSGRLWAGSMGAEPENGHVLPNKGSFCSFGPEGMKTHFNNVGISNGLAWDPSINKLYYIDTMALTVDAFDFDIEKATIKNRTPIFTPAKHGVEGFLDGMAIDTEGNLWIAMFNGYQVIQIDPRKPETLLQSIKIPSKQVTSVAFGGPNLDEIYVTSASFTVDGVVLPPPNHGATYRITGTGAKGYPGVNFKL